MATMRDVAERAGVSIATVSFVVNDTKRVTPATRERIETAMAELGFRRNVVARALASRRTRIIAMAFPALDHRLVGTAVSFVTSAARAAAAQGYHLVLWPVSNDAEELTELLDQGLVDGVVLMEVLLDDPRVSALQARQTPFALIGRTRDATGLPHVDIDFDRTVENALEHLAGLGHRDIVLVTEESTAPKLPGYGPIVRTEAAFERVTSELGIAGTLMHCAQNADAGRDVAARILAESPQTTAIVIMNEDAAVGVVSTMNRRGIRLPEDLSVLSVSSTRGTAAMTDPRLTIMTSPGDTLGQLGVEMLIKQLEGEELPGPTLLPCVLEPGETTGPPTGSD